MRAREQQLIKSGEKSSSGPRPPTGGGGAEAIENYGENFPELAGWRFTGILGIPGCTVGECHVRARALTSELFAVHQLPARRLCPSLTGYIVENP
jgi:hypothetical protein